MKMKVFATFREICGNKTIHVPFEDGDTIGKLLQSVIEQYPPMQEELFENEDELKPHIHVFINGKNVIHMNGLETEVEKSDELALFPPVAGG
ncbi:MoaD/ThiS family protein [Bacillus shivajii]|uniref:ubiquitin-like small modifier protein 1 n=1 Tax=Bacillus shivajii TaxID=1983719 RepID=UPI001CF99641|nr:ubiquitin-like small modifier protein 1 [Bacillus shivajii]UCZ54671.1 MoaD/ThiS family protein [Bacillus shivajii]